MTTEHFEGLRRGFNDTMYVEKFVPFTPADFAWTLSDTVRRSHGPQSLVASLIGTPAANVIEHLTTLATGRAGNHVHAPGRQLPGRQLPGLQATYYLRLEWDYSGCPSVRTKKARNLNYAAGMEELRGSQPALEHKACDAFNQCIADVIAVCNREYLLVWHRCVTDGSHRDAWVLGDGREAEVRAYKDLTEREAQLTEAVRLARRQLSALRDEKHAAYQALACARMADEGWTDNDKVAFPAELREHMEKTFAETVRLHDPFGD